MLKWAALAGILLAMIVCLSPAAAVDSADVVHINANEAVALLSGDSPHGSGAQIVVAVTQGYRQEPPGNGTRVTIAFVDITFRCEEDGPHCDTARRITAFGHLSADEFVVDQRLSRAALATRMEGRDVSSGETVDVFVNLTWEGRGGFQRSFDHVSSDEGGERFVVTGFHIARSASVEGSVGGWSVAGAGTLTRLGSVSVVPRN